MLDLLDIAQEESKSLLQRKRTSPERFSNSVQSAVSTSILVPSKECGEEESYFSGIYPIILLGENDTYHLNAHHQHEYTKRGLLESISYPSRANFYFNSVKNLYAFYEKLDFSNINVRDVAMNIITECLKKHKMDIIISMTGDDEILIYRHKDDCYNNLIIDEDADVEVLLINKKAKKTETKTYYFQDSLDYSFLVNQL